MQLADGNLNGGSRSGGRQPGISQMLRYVVLRLLQFGGVDDLLLRAARATTSRCQKTAEIIDDRVLLHIIQRIDRFVQCRQIGSDEGIEALRTRQMKRQRSP